MADLREVFPILQDDATGAGEAPISRIEGEVAAGKEGLIGFSWKDSSGNVILPQLTAEGKIPVDTEALVGTCLYEVGEDAAPTAATDNDVVTMVLNLGNDYNNIMMSGSCLRTCKWTLVHIDDVGGVPAEVILGYFRTGPGQFSYCCASLCRYLDTTGGTGVQNLVLRANPITHVSTVSGELAANELGAS